MMRLSPSGHMGIALVCVVCAAAAALVLGQTPQVLAPAGEAGSAELAAAESKSSAAATPLVWNIGQNNYTVSNPAWGGERNFYLYVPSGYSLSEPISLVYAIHGLGDHALHFSTRTNITAKAEELNFLAVYPQGTTGILGTGWNAGVCCVANTIDDVDFLMSIHDSVLATFSNLRLDSVHSLGFSNGGFMSERLGCERGDVFASIGSVSGNTVLEPGWTDGLASCDKAYASPVSVLHVHGNEDPVVPWTGDELLGFVPVPQDIASWRARNKCTGNGQQTFNISTFSNTLWQECGYGNTTVELVLNQGGAHVYPMQIGVWEVTDYILDFWRRVTPGSFP